ncbi:adenosine kinase [Saccharobesus litoralis]|uniref:Adenosine kinase n=1 Tax=Saccharobesus litoralis TaxID=2172099 RepID=A0A2S0VW25_9ALTE|nr:adenosine kinase [Saccharobesus litoralis]AWB68395.1 adenosine kinase [Saccharobesus litoralis]
MAKYNVYGLGNALVDKEFEVTDAFLAEQNIEKGLMTLIEQEQQQSLLAGLQANFDLKKRAGGGSAANSLVGLSQFGGSAFYACKVGNDEFGRFYADDLAASGVTTRLNELSTQGNTGTCLVMVTDDAERTMNTYLGCTADLSTNELFIEELSQADYLYIEGYLVPSPTALEAIAAAKQQAKADGVKIAMTFSDPSMVKYFKDGIDQALGNERIDLLFCNEEEAQTFTDTNTVADASQALLKRAKTVVITLGAKGLLVIDDEKQVEVAGQPAKAVDTNGAGDMVAGAFLYGLSQNWDYAKAGELACKAASVVVSHFGPRLSKEQQQEILKDFL